MKKFAVIFIFLFSLCFPLLAEDILNNPAYIAQLGYGSTKDSAESNALAALSKFFQMNISVQAKEQTILNDSDFETTLSEEVFVQSYTELFAVHYTKSKYDSGKPTLNENFPFEYFTGCFSFNAFLNSSVL